MLSITFISSKGVTKTVYDKNVIVEFNNVGYKVDINKDEVTITINITEKLMKRY
jgi:hypothetical protein